MITSIIPFSPDPLRRARNRLRELNGLVRDALSRWQPAPSVARPEEAYWFDQTQRGNHARARVLPWDRLPRSERHLEIIDWPEHEGWNEEPER